MVTPRDHIRLQHRRDSSRPNTWRLPGSHMIAVVYVPEQHNLRVPQVKCFYRVPSWYRLSRVLTAVNTLLSRYHDGTRDSELEITIQRAVREGIQEKTSKEQSEIIKGLLEVVKDIVGHLSESKNVFDCKS
ncbi:unnamed protein product [Timema podura]|uniref:Uncharacterized protein n=1 Tax=Timema podura TaxID=61482 RepID=A0ABN7P7F7_TIMPD|nr:unnamed protein product [Timema podura]